MKRHYLIYLCLISILVACAPPWKLMPENEIVSGKTYRVDLPAGWMRNTANKEVLFISHDGPALQGIEIREATHYEAFKKIKETSIPGILPSELAELTLALIKNEFPATRVVLLENTPALVAGHQGFRMHFKYETSKGLDYEGVVTGFATSQQVYMIKYYGTSLHYFPLSLPVYEDVVKSFQVAE
jgi:hypothetical protein